MKRETNIYTHKGNKKGNKGNVNKGNIKRNLIITLLATLTITSCGITKEIVNKGGNNMGHINSFQLVAIKHMASTRDNRSLTLAYNNACNKCCRRGKANNCSTCAVELAYTALLHMSSSKRTQVLQEAIA